MSITDTTETPNKESPRKTTKETVKEIVGIVGATVVTGGLVLGSLAFANKGEQAKMKRENVRPDIGCKFSDLEAAKELRNYGLLDKNVVAEACGNAFKEFLETGKTDAVVIQVPPRPSREQLLEMVSKQKQGIQPTPAP